MKMNYFIKIFFLFLIINCPVLYSLAQFQLSPNSIALNESAMVTITLDKEAKGIDVPNTKKIRIRYLGVSPMSSFSMTIINGKVTRNSTKQWIYRYRLFPLKTGSFKIPHFTIHYKDGQVEKTTVSLVTVTKKRRQQQSSFFPFMNMRQESVVDVLTRFSQTTAYKNSPVIVDILLVADNKDDLSGGVQQSAPFAAENAVFYDISTNVSLGPVFMTNINGSEMFARVVKRYVLYPMEAGRLAVQSPTLLVMTSQGILRLNDQARPLDVLAFSKKSGAVYIGDLSLSEEVQTNAAVGDELSLTLNMTGSGQLNLLSDPYADVKINGLVFLKPEVGFSFLTQKDKTVYFRQTVRYKVMAEKAGQYRLPDLKIDYFDKNHREKSIQIPGQILVVENTMNIHKKDSILAYASRTKDFHFVLFSPLPIILIILFLFLPVGTYFYGLHWDKISQDPAFARQTFADKQLLKRIKAADEIRREGNLKEYYGTLEKAVLYYLCDKYGVDRGLREKEIFEILSQKGLSGEQIDKIRAILARYRNSAYAPMSDHTDDISVSNLLAILKIKRPLA